MWYPDLLRLSIKNPLPFPIKKRLPINSKGNKNADNRSSHQRCSIKKGVLRNFAKFLRKRLCQSLFFNKVAGLRAAILLKKRLWHTCFPMNFAKFQTAPFLQNTSWRLLLMQSNFLSLYSLIKNFSISLCSTFYFLLKTFFLLLMTYLKRVTNEYFRLETARLTKRKSVEVFNI